FARSGAVSAITTNASVSAAPEITSTFDCVPACSRHGCHQRPHVRPARLYMPVTRPVGVVMASVPDPRVDVGVHEVDGERHEHDDEPEEHRDPLYHRVVAVPDRARDLARDAWPVEHVLGEDRAAQEEREREADDGDDGD